MPLQDLDGKRSRGGKDENQSVFVIGCENPIKPQISYFLRHDDSGDLYKLDDLCGELHIYSIYTFIDFLVIFTEKIFKTVHTT